MRKRGVNELPRTLHFHSHDVLRTICRKTGGRQYLLLREALARLQATLIVANIRVQRGMKHRQFSCDAQQPHGSCCTLGEHRPAWLSPRDVAKEIGQALVLHRAALVGTAARDPAGGPPRESRRQPWPPGPTRCSLCSVRSPVTSSRRQIIGKIPRRLACSW